MTDTPTLAAQIQSVREAMTIWDESPDGIYREFYSVKTLVRAVRALLAVSSEAPQEEIEKRLRAVEAAFEHVGRDYGDPVKEIQTLFDEVELWQKREIEATIRAHKAEARLSALEGPMKELKATLDNAGYVYGTLRKLVIAARALIAAAEEK